MMNDGNVLGKWSCFLYNQQGHDICYNKIHPLPASMSDNSRQCNHISYGLKRTIVKPVH